MPTVKKKTAKKTAAKKPVAKKAVVKKTTRRTVTRRTTARAVARPVAPVVVAKPRPAIDPIMAVKKFWTGYFNVTGRSTRSEFWFGILFAFILSFVFMFFVGGIIATIVNYILVIPTVALMVRRFRDAGVSVWWYLIPELLLVLAPMFFGASWAQAMMMNTVTLGMKIYAVCFWVFFIFKLFVACIPSKK